MKQKAKFVTGVLGWFLLIGGLLGVLSLLSQKREPRECKKVLAARDACCAAFSET